MKFQNDKIEEINLNKMRRRKFRLYLWKNDSEFPKAHYRKETKKGCYKLLSLENRNPERKRKNVLESLCFGFGAPGGYFFIFNHRLEAKKVGSETKQWGKWRWNLEWKVKNNKNWNSNHGSWFWKCVESARKQCEMRVQVMFGGLFECVIL